MPRKTERGSGAWLRSCRRALVKATWRRPCGLRHPAIPKQVLAAVCFIATGPGVSSIGHGTGAELAELADPAPAKPTVTKATRPEWIKCFDANARCKEFCMRVPIQRKATSASGRNEAERVPHDFDGRWVAQWHATHMLGLTSLEFRIYERQTDRGPQTIAPHDVGCPLLS